MANVIQENTKLLKAKHLEPIWEVVLLQLKHKEKIQKENKKENIKKMKRVKGKSHFYNNGVINVIDQSCPVGFKPGRIKNW